MPTEIYYEDSSFETYFDCLTPACIVHSICFPGGQPRQIRPHLTHGPIQHKMLGESLLIKNL